MGERLAWLLCGPCDGSCGGAHSLKVVFSTVTRPEPLNCMHFGCSAVLRAVSIGGGDYQAPSGHRCQKTVLALLRSALHGRLLGPLTVHLANMIRDLSERTARDAVHRVIGIVDDVLPADWAIFPVCGEEEAA